MRARDPHDDPPAKRRPTPYRGPPVTLGHLRSHGCRRLLIYCSTGLCHHSAVVDADRWPDYTAIRDLCPKAVCTQCGPRARPASETLHKKGHSDEFI